MGLATAGGKTKLVFRNDLRYDRGQVLDGDVPGRSGPEADVGRMEDYLSKLQIEIVIWSGRH